MWKTRKILTVTLLALALCGCGKTNLLQWTAPAQKTNELEKARNIIDTAKTKADYQKAYNLVKDDDSNEGKVIRAEALLGRSGIDLAAIIDALEQGNLDLGGGQQSASPILKLERLVVDSGVRADVLAAGELFLSSVPPKTSDKVIGALTGLIAHTANLRQAAGDFKSYLTGKDDADECQSFYTALGTNKLAYITMAVNFLSGGDEKVQEAITAANAALKTIDASIEFVAAVNDTDGSTSDEIYVEIAQKLLDNIDETIFKEFGYEGTGKLTLAVLKDNITDALNNDSVAKAAVAAEIKDSKSALPAQAAPWRTVKVLFGL
ncbi:hypothetical protein NO2_1183 [Candidatus Termititenax persephonae]|uniref:Lipoprotein n=1 Tax=Candidatus Termititenax persephonae TaxID=2218525 RepID=A0A388TIC1_9BACT|nr:hypothetical protein NO2_1183 [Candidatus Termititenax persephonae]